jgi:hypothetical protein
MKAEHTVDGAMTCHPRQDDCDLSTRSEPYSTTRQEEEEYLMKPQNELVQPHQH